MEQVPDNAPVSAAAIGFAAFSEVYLRLVEGLIKKNIHPVEACRIATEIANGFLTFTNNNKFAEVADGIQFTQEEVE